MTSKPAVAIWPEEVNSYAASAALNEAKNKGWITEEQLMALAERANKLADALLAGKVLRPNKATGEYDIVSHENDEDDDNIVIDA